MGRRIRAAGWLACFLGFAAVGCSDDSGGAMKPDPTSGAGTSATAGSPAAGIAAPAATGGSGATSGAAGTMAAAGGRTARPMPPATGTGGTATSTAGTGMTAMPVAGTGTAMPAAGAGSTAMPPPGPPGTWPAADPGKMGPFATVTENNVGPNNSYTMFRPMELTQRHPVITWGNGTGTTPTVYGGMLRQYASHGFIVIASNSENVGQGNPPPMLDGVTWVLEQDMTEGSALYQHVDRDRVGATGHSQGAAATTRAGMDPRVKTIAPIQILTGSRGFHGPVLAICGAMDTTLPCSRNLSTYNGVGDQAAMYAELIPASHTNWIAAGRGGGANPTALITTAWFRVHLMNDMALRAMFYGECSLCKDTATWVTMRKMME